MSCVSAQAEPQTPTFGDELKSPWTTDARPWVLGGVAATAALLIFEDQTVDPIQADIAKDRPIGSASKFGDYGGQLVPNGIYALGMFGYGWMSGDSAARNNAWLMTKASAYAVTASTVLKYAVREPRPAGGDRTSFPSGHTTAAFAFSTFVAGRHGLFPYGVPTIGISMLTAFSRINDNRHFTHDVVAGATIGTAYGLGISLLHGGTKNEMEVKPGTLSIEGFAPVYERTSRGTLQGAVLGLRF